MAPSARQVQKAEAKYGVTADYPDLQLHSAAANGNVGLVKYALMHGQPVNSVLNGVLPIHIAASSGNEKVVQMLIEAGADVNAARLPRKYNTDRSKAISSIGAAGSTPLHFAAANGHANVVSLLLSHNANPELAEKHGLTPEDLARESGHPNVLTVLRLWRQSEHIERAQYAQSSTDNIDTVSLAPSSRSARSSPTRRLHPGNGSTKDLRSVAAANISGNNGRKLLTKPSLDSISNKGKKLAKAASNPNLAAFLSGNSSFTPSSPPTPSLTPNFPAPAPLTLRQNPSSSAYMHRQTTLPSPTNPLMHHIINMDKARRPSLPSVFEKAAHPSQSLKSALGMTPTGSTFGKHRSFSSSHGDDIPNDPYHLGRPSRSGSKTSLSSVFRTNHNRDRDPRSEPTSQPLSPAASSFFTADDELEGAERDAFVRMDREVSSGEEMYQQPRHDYFKEPYPPRRPLLLERRASAEGVNGRSRAGSGSSAATTGSGRSMSARGYQTSIMSGSSSLTFPVTAPPTQSTFFPLDPASSSSDLASMSQMTSRPALSPLSSSSSIVIPQPIPPPPSSSTQPFFSKAAISAAHNNTPLSRSGFYRPRKSSLLSTTASSMTRSGSYMSSPEIECTPRQFQHSTYNESLYNDDAAAQNDDNDEAIPSTGPSVIIRRPTIRENSNNGQPEFNVRKRSPSSPASPELSESLESSLSVSPMVIPEAPPGTVTCSPNKHSRASSDGTGTLRSSPHATPLPYVSEHASLDIRQRSASHGPRSANGGAASDQEMDAETARESQDTFPTNQERPFLTRSRAGSRARVDSGGSSTNSIPYMGAQMSPNLQPITAFGTVQQHHLQGHEIEASWSAVTRPGRSGSTGTDTRTSRSGSTGEGPGHLPRFFGFDYSSSPASSSSFNYQPSNSTTATSLVSSPPGTAGRTTPNYSQPPSEGKGTTVTHAEARSIVKRKEEELLHYDPSTTLHERSEWHGPTLSQQLAAYGESLSIERELSRAEKSRKSSDHEITLTILEPPPIAKYSWEILGKERRTTVPLTAGKRAKDNEATAPPQQRLWTHKMVSPFEVPLPRPGTNSSSHKHVGSIGQTMAIASNGKPSTRGTLNEIPGNKIPLSASTNDTVSSASQGTQMMYNGRDTALRNKASNLSVNSSYLAPPITGSSEVSASRSGRRVPSASPSRRSPRSSLEKERLPSMTFHVVAGPNSEPNDSANSSSVSEPRSTLRHLNASHSSYTTPYHQKHKLSRSDPHSKSLSNSPETALANEETPRPLPQILRLETTVAPKFHTENKAGGDFAPSPSKSRFASKLGKLFNNK